MLVRLSNRTFSAEISQESPFNGLWRFTSPVKSKLFLPEKWQRVFQCLISSSANFFLARWRPSSRTASASARELNTFFACIHCWLTFLRLFIPCIKKSAIHTDEGHDQHSWLILQSTTQLQLVLIWYLVLCRVKESLSDLRLEDVTRPSIVNHKNYIDNEKHISLINLHQQHTKISLLLCNWAHRKFTYINNTGLDAFGHFVGKEY